MTFVGIKVPIRMKIEFLTIRWKVSSDVALGLNVHLEKGASSGIHF